MPEERETVDMHLILSVDRSGSLARIAKALDLTEQLNFELKQLRSMYSCEVEKTDDLKQGIK